MFRRLSLLLLVMFGMLMPAGQLFAQENNPNYAENYAKRFLKGVPGIDQKKDQQADVQKQQPADTRKTYVPKAKWNYGNLQRHWEKHHAEFPEFKTEKEYGDNALLFFQYPPKGTLFKRNEAGDYLFYHQPSNTFGVTTKDGVPKTMFRPSAGIKYWNRQ